MREEIPTNLKLGAPGEYYFQIKEKESYRIDNVIRSDIFGPLEFAKSLHMADIPNSNKLVTYTENSIQIYEDAINKFPSILVEGVLRLDPFVSDLGINTGLTYSNQGLIKKLKFKRSLFPTLEDHLNFIKKLNDLQVRFESVFVDTKDNLGNKDQQKTIKNLNSESIEIKLKTKLYGKDEYVYAVHLGIEATSTGYVLYLESEEYADLIKNEAIAIVDGEIDALKGLGICCIRK